jgi:hypothetical protein
MREIVGMRKIVKEYKHNFISNLTFSYNTVEEEEKVICDK